MKERSLFRKTTLFFSLHLFLMFFLFTSVLPAAAAPSLEVLPGPTVLTYHGNGEYTSSFGLHVNVDDTQVMFYALDLVYDPLELNLDTSVVSLGSFYTLENEPAEDTYFTRIEKSAGSGTVTITGCRMISDVDNKGVEGESLPLYLSMRFVSLTSDLPETVTLTNFDFRDGSGRSIIPALLKKEIGFSLPEIAAFLLSASPRTNIQDGDQFLLTVVAVDDRGNTVTAYNDLVWLSSDSAQLNPQSDTVFGPLVNGIGSEEVQVTFAGPATVFTVTAVRPGQAEIRGTLKLNGTDLHTIVRAEGRAENNNGGIQVKLIDSDNSIHTALTTETGLVVFTNLPDGTYHLLAEDSGALDRVLTGITIANGIITSGDVLVETLLAGDVNADNAVNDFDRSLMMSFYGQSTTLQSLAADLDRDGDIDMDDALLGAENFGRTGDTVPEEDGGGIIPVQ